MGTFYNRRSFQGVTVRRFVICESTADPQILWPKLHAHAHLRCLALVHISRMNIHMRACISSKLLLSCVIVYDTINNSGLN